MGRDKGGYFFAERKAHAPLPAGACVDHGVGVVITENHRNWAAGRGCMTRLVGFVFILVGLRENVPKERLQALPLSAVFRPRHATRRRSGLRR